METTRGTSERPPGKERVNEIARLGTQNFNENISILIMLALYSAMIHQHLHIDIIILAFGSFVSLVMYAIIRLHKRNQAKEDSLHLIGMKKEH